MRYVFSLIIVLVVHLLSYAQTNNLTGDWYVTANGGRMTVSIAKQGEKYVAFAESNGCAERLDNVAWDSETELLEFRRRLGGSAQWYKVTIADGVMVGRFASVTDGAKPPLLAYKYRVTGWCEAAFASTPVVFDVVVDNRSRGRLRVDRDLSGRLVGRLKFYALDNAVWEHPEEEIAVTEWDGVTLKFQRGAQCYTGIVEGGAISGTFTGGSAVRPWRGSRAEVLTYGIAPKTPEARAAWQQRTRRNLYRLMMAGNPAPLSTTVEVIRDNLPPIVAEPWPNRDDDPGAHPQDYTLTELRLTYTLPNWLGGEPISRVVHAYLSKPTAPPPGNLERYPLVVALNGHVGSAYQTFNPGAHCWYGDAFARRGYMVLAVDVGHRPPADVVQFGSATDLFGYLGYAATPDPDDPAGGNDFHPSIKPAGYDAYHSDWEEDGERTWDVIRAIDYALSRLDVDPQRVVVTGMSLGGEVTSYVGALDPRVAATVSAGFSPDMSVLKYLGGHGCWNWSWADIREYIDHADLFALAAPHPLIVQTGEKDIGFSIFPQWASLPVPLGSAPFASDKQVMRRARTAYAGGTLFHYLHPLAHEWQSGVAGGLSYATVVEPQSASDLLWQADATTGTNGRSVFDYLREFLSF
jgi:dienelactone hydrolase